MNFFQQKKKCKLTHEMGICPFFSQKVIPIRKGNNIDRYQRETF